MQRELNLCKRRWLELLKDFYMSVFYHSGKTNVVADALSQLSMRSMSHIDDEKKDLVKEVQQLARLGVQLANAPSGGVLVHLGSESSFVVNFKANHHLDRVLMDLKDLVLIKLNELFSLGGDGVLGYQN